MSKKNKKKQNSTNRPVDPKYLGVPNICFSLITKGDDREIDYKKQRIERGFDDSETWSLSDTFANFMIPRLERYLEIVYDGVNGINGIKKEAPDIIKVILALKLLARDEGGRTFTPEEKKSVKDGLTLLGADFAGWWW